MMIEDVCILLLIILGIGLQIALFQKSTEIIENYIEKKVEE